MKILENTKNRRYKQTKEQWAPFLSLIDKDLQWT